MEKITVYLNDFKLKNYFHFHYFHVAPNKFTIPRSLNVLIKIRLNIIIIVHQPTKKNQ